MIYQFPVYYFTRTDLEYLNKNVCVSLSVCLFSSTDSLHDLLFLPHSNLLVYSTKFSVFLDSFCSIILPSFPRTQSTQSTLNPVLRKPVLIRARPSFLTNWVIRQFCFQVMASFPLQILHLLESSTIFPGNSLKKLSKANLGAEQRTVYNWSAVEDLGFCLQRSAAGFHRLTPLGFRSWLQVFAEIQLTAIENMSQPNKCESFAFVDKIEKLPFIKLQV